MIQFEANVNKKIFIEKRYIDALLKWNQMKIDINTRRYDVKFIRLLLVVVVGMANLIPDNIHPELRQFIKDIFQIRVGNNLIRLLQFDAIVDDYVKELDAKKKQKDKQN